MTFIQACPENLLQLQSQTSTNYFTHLPIARVAYSPLNTLSKWRPLAVPQLDRRFGSQTIQWYLMRRCGIKPPYKNRAILSKCELVTQTQSSPGGGFSKLFHFNITCGSLWIVERERELLQKTLGLVNLPCLSGEGETPGAMHTVCKLVPICFWWDIPICPWNPNDPCFSLEKVMFWWCWPSKIGVIWVLGMDRLWYNIYTDAFLRKNKLNPIIHPLLQYLWLILDALRDTGPHMKPRWILHRRTPRHHVGSPEGPFSPGVTCVCCELK